MSMDVCKYFLYKRVYPSSLFQFKHGSLLTIHDCLLIFKDSSTNAMNVYKDNNWYQFTKTNTDKIVFVKIDVETSNILYTRELDCNLTCDFLIYL